MPSDEIDLQITVVQPPRNVAFCMQRGKDDLVPPSQASGEELAFSLTLRVTGERASGPPNLRGPFAQGPPAARFLYVNSGTMAGQWGSCWTRRAKVPLTGITWELIDRCLEDQGCVLHARIAGKAKDGGPACASVPLLDDGWQVLQREERS